jgi:Mg2+ and Co2+ transporter CorA
MMINTARMQENTGLTLEDVAWQQAVVQKLQQQLQVKQDVRMTVFTSVTVVFLPLSFFTSVCLPPCPHNLTLTNQSSISV